jgi:hypothetical protein
MSDTQSPSGSGTGDPGEIADDSTEVDDQPLGVPEDLDPEDAPLPGIPEAEPPAAS